MSYGFRHLLKIHDMPHKNMCWNCHNNPLPSTPTHVDRPLIQKALSPAINKTFTRAKKSYNSKVSITHDFQRD